MPDPAKDKAIEVWWQDEARVGQRGELARVWALKGTRPDIPRDQRFGCTYIFGAVCPEQNKGAAIIMPKANTHAMNEHLKEISFHVAKRAHAIVIMDRAGWHMTSALNVPDNITLVPLPPYSPELNPVENIWQYLKSNFLNNRVFDTYEDIIKACVNAWNSLIKNKGQIKSIAARKWANLKSVS